MKHTRLAVLAGVLVSILAAGWVLAAIQPSQAPQGQWKVVIPKTNVGEKWRMAAFLNENIGLTGGAGDVGKARYTSDGGKTWTAADSSGG